MEARDAHVPPPLRGDGSDPAGRRLLAWPTTRRSSCRAPRGAAYVAGRSGGTFCPGAASRGCRAAPPAPARKSGRPCTDLAATGPGMQGDMFVNVLIDI